MLLKLTGYKNGGHPVMIDTSALVIAEEVEDIYTNGQLYTALDLVTDGVRIVATVQESTDQIYAAIEELEKKAGAFYE